MGAWLTHFDLFLRVNGTYKICPVMFRKVIFRFRVVLSAPQKGLERDLSLDGRNFGTGDLAIDICFHILEESIFNNAMCKLNENYRWLFLVRMFPKWLFFFVLVVQGHLKISVYNNNTGACVLFYSKGEKFRFGKICNTSSCGIRRL